jgi:hypothetical protein
MQPQLRNWHIQEVNLAIRNALSSNLSLTLHIRSNIVKIPESAVQQVIQRSKRPGHT